MQVKKGDIVLVPFPFTDLLGNKNRPAVVPIDLKDDVTVCFMTTQLQWQSENDVLIESTEMNGLRKTTVIHLNIFVTPDKDMILGRLGRLEKHYKTQLNSGLIKILQLNS